MDRIYLDHAATTPVEPRVCEEMRRCLETLSGNPSSPHQEGRAARRAVEEARDSVAALIGAEADEIVFTGSASEANHLGLAGVRHAGWRIPGSLAVAGIEHPSVLAAARRLDAAGRNLAVLAVDAQGLLEFADLDAHLAGGGDQVAVMAASNEVGTVQDWALIAQRCQAHGALLHVDAVQVAGKLPFDVAVLRPGATASISAHKLGGPKGVGALWVARETRLEASIAGSQERERRGGTENVAGIVGFGAACRIAGEQLAERLELRRANERIFLAALSERCPDVRQWGAARDGRLPGLLSLRFPGASGEALLFALDLAGVAVSQGAACSSGAVQPSHVLSAMGKTRVENLETLRISLGWQHTEEELVEAARRLEAALLQVRK